MEVLGEPMENVGGDASEEVEHFSGVPLILCLFLALKNLEMEKIYIWQRCTWHIYFSFREKDFFLTLKFSNIASLMSFMTVKVKCFENMVLGTYTSITTI